MPYAGDRTSFTFREFLVASRKRFFKGVAKHFPLNRIRVWALRKCGYQVGNQVYIGEELQVTEILENTSCRLFIGNRVAIAQRVIIVLDSDPNWSKLFSKVEIVRGQVHIGDDAWIGAGAILLPNVHIGEMAIVGAGSVVTRDVAAYTVVAGNPAKLLRTIPKE